MVKLIVIARCIPEDVYLAHTDHILPAAAGKKFSVVVREPESWYIGRLAIEIQTRYEALYKRPLGQIKYLKDAEDDCDLDLELTVADLLVDEGKALKDGSDQKRIVLVVVDQGRAVRQGSVVPDLTPIHYQPSIKPPVPKFPGPEKRVQEEQELDIRPPKRRRLDQIEEDDGDEVISSIEGQYGVVGRDRRSPSHFEVPGAHFLSALNTGNVDRAAAEIKRESPGPQFWTNPTPATRDELELLPQQPQNWQPHQRRTGLPPSRLQNGSAEREVRRGNTSQSAKTPVTPGTRDQVQQSSSANAISMLNGMKSVSPGLRQPSTSSAGRFRASRKNVYDLPESDVEDSQMSPESRAGRKPITPRLVQTPRSTDTNLAAKGNFRSTLLKKPIMEKTPTRIESVHDESTLMPDGTEPMDHELSNGQKNVGQNVQMNDNTTWERDGFSKLGETTANQKNNSNEILATNEQGGAIDPNENDGSDAEHSGKAASESQKAASSREGRSSSGATSTSRSSSVASSGTGAGRSTSSKSTGRRLSYAHDRKVLTGNEEDETLDSPGVQLEENLRQSSPVPRKSTQSRSRTSTTKSSARDDAGEDAMAVDVDEEEDVSRPPDSVSDYEEAIRPVKILKRTISQITTVDRPQSTSSAAIDANDELRCYTCWYKSQRCDNARPKCASCEKNKKNCQIYDMTKRAADKEKRDRKLSKSSAPRPMSRGTPSRSRKITESRMSEEVVSASDRDDESEPEDDDDKEDEQRAVSKAKASAHSKLDNGKFKIKVPALIRQDSSISGPSRSKLKIDKKKSKIVEQEEGSESDQQTTDEQINATFEQDKADPTAQIPIAAAPVAEMTEAPAADSEEDTRSVRAASNAKVKKERVKNTKPALNLDAHCAVLLESGEPCTRNIACKSHKVNAKRAVPGRSQPFDNLLKQYQETLRKRASGKEGPERSEPERQQVSLIKEQPGTPAGTLKPPFVQQKSVDSASTKSQNAKASSVASHTASTKRVLPPGMTEEEYDRLVSERAEYVRPDHKARSLVSRKSTGSQKETSPLVVRTQGSQDARQQSNKPTSSIKSDDKVTSSSQASNKRRQGPAPAQPEPNSHIFAAATTSGPVITLQPKSASSRSVPAKQAAADARLNGRLLQHPVKANTAATMNSDKHANPPYRQPLKKTLSAAPQDLSNARSLKDLRLKIGGSGASTPQPQSARDRLAGFNFNSSARSKQGFQLDEEEEEEETESEDESPVREEIKPKTPRFTAVNAPMNGIANILSKVRPRLPADDETSEDSDDGIEW